MFDKQNAAWLAPLLLAGCASLSPQQCMRADWRQIGFTDGTDGVSAARINDHAKACAEVGVRPDLDMYLRGREEGLYRYCQPEKAFSVGRNGGVPNSADCPEHLKASFMDGYRQGYQVHMVEQDLSERRARIYRNNSLIRRDNERIAEIREELSKKELPDDRRKALLHDFNRLVEEKNYVGSENVRQMVESDRLQAYLNMLLRDVGRWR